MPFIKHERGTALRTAELEGSILAQGSVSLNKAAHAETGFAEAFVQHYDPENKLIGLEPVRRGTPDSFPLVVSGGNRTMSFKTFATRFRIPLAPTRRYRLEWRGGMLILDLKQKPIALTGRDGAQLAETAKQGGR